VWIVLADCAQGFASQKLVLAASFAFTAFQLLC
jgi:hypothetical protein